MKTENKRALYYSSFILDIGFTFFLSHAGFNPIEALFCAEIVMWLGRLSSMNFKAFGFIVRRLLNIIPILATVVALGFLVIELAPGDVLSQMRLNPDLRPDTLLEFEKAFSLDRPWYERLVAYAGNVIRGDFGYSELSKAPVFSVVRTRAANTLVLALASLVLAWVVSVPVGLYASLRRYKPVDRIVSIASLIGLSIPHFFLAFILVFAVASTGAWLPLGGMESVNFGDMSFPEKALDLARHMVLPVAVLATGMIARLVPLVRASAIEIIGKQFIVAARAKGLTESRIVISHVAKNAMLPMIAIFGTQLGSLLSGAVVVEQVLSWPGLGKLILGATLSQDLYLVAGSLVYGVVLAVCGNLVADIILAYADPRVRMSA